MTKTIQTQESLELLCSILGNDQGIYANDEGYIYIPCSVPRSQLSKEDMEDLPDRLKSDEGVEKVFKIFSYFVPIDVYFAEGVRDDEKVPVLDAISAMLKECDMD